MKTKDIIYPLVIILALAVPISRYYASTPEVNACVQTYVDNLPYSGNKGYIYEINGRRHIEPANSKNIKSLRQYLVGKSEGCMMYSDNILDDLNNTVYCAVTYLIKNAPINDNLKQPLALLKSE